ncbi:Ig-like domain-containing protein [Streptomyces sp. NPDC051907]|uniref:Ig-like domain-containing protein n=1 Tax=Streptomyces sp. NPDC051907 TaxID=3155284 RepID=UPI0034310CE6
MAAAGVAMAVLGVGACGSETAKSSESAAGKAGAGAAGTAAPTGRGVLELGSDEESAGAGEALVVKVLTNDNVTLADGTGGNVQMVLDDAAFSVAVETQPAHGTATVDGNTIVYKSTAGYVGEDKFTYRVKVTTGEALSETAVARITVAAPTSSPKTATEPDAS